MISDLFKKFSKGLWFLPGFLLWAAYPPMGERIDVLFALAPLIWLNRREVAPWIAAKRWFQSGMFYWIATLSWMPAIVKNGGPWPLVALGWFALAAYCALYFAVYGYLGVKAWSWARCGSYARRLLVILVVEPILWCGLELARSRLFGGFSWNQLGIVPINSGFGAPAVLGGVYLCSAMVILVNGTIAGIVERMWKPERSGFSALRQLGFIETLLALLTTCGIYMSGVSFLNAHTSEESLKVAMIQRNFPCVFKAQDENPYEAYGRLLANISTLKPDLVVLPESAMCEFGPVDQQGAVRFAEWVNGKTGAAVLAGGTRYKEGKIYNCAMLYQFDGTGDSCFSNKPTHLASCGIYDKVHLVPFGEFVPGDKWFPSLQKLAPVGSCTPGEPKTLLFKTFGIGTAICFEDTDSAQTRLLARLGARMLFFITNDSWFSQSVEAEQHAWQSVARAIETGLPVVRVGNSGVTGTIAPDGKTTWLIDEKGKPLVDRAGTMFDRVPLACSSEPTPYVRLGDGPLICAFGIIILFLSKRRFMTCV